MRASSMFVVPPRDAPSWVLRGDAVELSLGRIEVTYRVPGESPRISVAGQPLSIDDAPPAQGTAAFALAAGSDSILVSDRDAGVAMLIPRDGASLLEAQAPLYVTEPDSGQAGQFRVTSHGGAASTGVLYVAQAFGHTTGWVPAVHGALDRLPEPVPFTAAIRRQEDAAYARRKAERSAGIHVVPLHYSDSESATITPADVANTSRPALMNREAALLWLADNRELARASMGAAAIVNDCRPETWILHQLAEHARQEEVPLHAVRYAFEEFEWLRQLARTPRSTKVASGVAELLAASAPAIHTRRELRDALLASGIDPRLNPSVDFEASSRALMAGVPESGTIWYQAVNWREWLSLESGKQPYVVIPPLGQASALSPEQAAERAGAFLAQRSPGLQHLFTPEDPRGVVLVSQGNGFSACSRRHWRAMLGLAARMEETQFLFAGGSVEDRAWLSLELERSRLPNVTLLGWIDEHWSTFLRALVAKPRATFVCRPGLSSIGAALVNGIPPLLMTPDPLEWPEGAVDAITAEVAMERAVYAFQLERLYATQCATHRDSPLPVLVDTLGDNPERALATLRRAVDPAVQLRQRAAINGYCDWSRVAHLIASVLAREAGSGALPIQVKRRVRDQELSVLREPFGALQPPSPRRHRHDGMRLVEHE
ncbi:hypothetical protein HPC49_02415 [Pyxidicoccus fallax]|uniref:Uncharacterized protein n=1 Tax=Pyxidicoccus fallax TaxID=394095 RepID=A0A848L9J7_9BACT|nr:hypothetical protein [Pyxidicoccus fallax]NMO15700.1 hypothetical protein [Pyxidicoccus fallax]NPC77107.1 hypothetical protein [Pyxidicoccus fallax]